MSTDLSHVSVVALMGSRAFFGAERANIDVMRILREHGARVTCVVRPEHWPENIALQKMLVKNGLDMRTSPWPDYPLRGWLKSFIRKTPLAVWRGNRRLAEICAEVNATHIHCYNPFNYIAFSFALSKSNLPLIYRCGDFPTTHNAFYRYAWRRLARSVEHVVTPSAFIKGLLLEQGIEAEKISVLPSPPPARSIFQSFSSPAPRRGLRFGYIGQISEHKGVRVLLEAFRQVLETHEDASLTLAGPLRSDFAKSCVAFCEADEKLRGKVFFLGGVEDVQGFFGDCDVHIAPTLHVEPYGIVAVEAKSACRPSIVFAGGGFSELVVHEREGLVVEQKDIAGLIAAMKVYLDNPSIARDHGAQARRSLDERLKVDQFADRWVDVYHRSSQTKPVMTSQ